ncbi:LeoA/HP0731 family dynamin-like GTPase [Macrococcus capreoli]
MLIKNYSVKKTESLNKLKQFQEEFIKPLEQNNELSNIEFLNDKIKKGYESIRNNEFSIAMFGAFSDGKSTIIKQLTGEEDIKISPRPETDGIYVYDYDGDIKIIDTPGMYSQHDNHSEITRKYISSANLILFVTAAENSIKESHKATISWIMNDLDKADSIIFVINKMDSVVDLYDDIAYQELVNIKKANLYNSIKEINSSISLDNIVCIAADPFGNGIEYWKEEDEYEMLSRFNLLGDKIINVLKNNQDKLIIKLTDSIIKDCKQTILNDVGNFNEKKKELISLEKKNLDFIKNEIGILDQDIANSYKNISERIESLRLEYLSNIQNLKDNKDFMDYYDRHIGDEAYILEEKINTIFKDEIDNLIENQTATIDKIQINTEKYQEQKSKLMSAGSNYGKYVATSISAIPNSELVKGIKIIRDTAKIPIKFKPWGMVKLANKLKFGGAALNVGIDALSTFMTLKSQQEFENEVNKHKTEMMELFKDLKSNNSEHQFLEKYFPYVAEMKKEQQKKEKLVESNKKSYYEMDNYLEKLKLYSTN